MSDEKLKEQIRKYDRQIAERGGESLFGKPFPEHFTSPDFYGLEYPAKPRARVIGPGSAKSGQ